MILVNGEKVEFKTFPNKECLYKANTDHFKNETTILFKYEEDADLIKLLLVTKKLKEYCPKGIVILAIAYMPYSRMDRSEGEICFTLKYIADFINSLGYDEILVFEPHSDVTTALLNNATGVNLTEQLFKDAIVNGPIWFDRKTDFVCYPDATAHKRYSKMGDFKAAIGIKNRDFETGHIKSLDIFFPMCNNDDKFGPVVDNVDGKNVVIVDDLCSKGGTFILTAKRLKALGAKRISLVVAHCETAIFDGDILKTDLIDKVVTSNTIVTHEIAQELDVNKKLYIADYRMFV